MKSAYDILGVARDATPDQIKRAYRKLARERHPDLDPDNPAADDAFKDLTAAYEVLSDPARRARHDAGQIDARGQSRGGTRTTGYDAKGRARRGPKKSDPFAKFRRKKRRENAIKVNGANVDYRLKLTAAEATRGGVKYISMTNGKRLKVTIPKSTRSGQVLRLKGQGMPGLGGGTDGDALVTVTLDHDADLRIDGRDVYTSLAISLDQAVLGGKVMTPTLDGNVSVTVPKNANTGRILRLRGRGLPADADHPSPGDQFVVLKVVLPAKPDPELRAFVETWSATKGRAKA